MALGKVIISKQLFDEESIFNFISDNFDILLSYATKHCNYCVELLLDSRYFEILDENDEIPFYSIIIKSDIHKNIWVAECVKY